MLLVTAKSILKQPKLLLLLLTSYKNIIIQEYRDVLTAMKIRFMLYVLSVIFLGLGMLSCVVSLLLWAALPILNPQNYWLMIVLPISLFTASPLLLILANRLKIQLNFIEIRKKIKLNTRRICQTPI
jgi:hypothetical protein